jgi:acetyltransferase-like isoleucine patch superfamily enzyme
MISKFLKLPVSLKIRYGMYYFLSSLRTLKFNIFHIYNLIRLKMSDVRIGKNFSTSGCMTLDIYPESSVIIGDNVVIVSDSRYASPSSLAFPAKLKTFSPTSKIIIGNMVGLNGTSITSRSKKIEIGNGTMIGPNVIIVDSDFHPPWPPENRRDYPGNEYDKEIKIGENCWIGMNTIILKGVTIGENSIIGAGSVVVKDIPPKSLATGVPAKVVKEY